MLQAPELSYIVRKMDEERPLEDATKATVCTHDKLMQFKWIKRTTFHDNYVIDFLCNYFVMVAIMMFNKSKL